MNTTTKCHGFTVNGRTDIQKQFNYAAQRFVERWQCKPPQLWHHETTPLPKNLGGLETAVDGQIPRGVWYFEIPEEVMQSDKQRQ